MISGFVCDCHGFMNDGDEKSYKFFEAGVNREGWFNNEDLVKQYIDTEPLMKRLHPECELLFGFDNSMNHHARAPGGLDAALLNLSDGGANVKNMRDGWYLNETGERVIHKMQNELGVQKGIRKILLERKKFLNSKGFPQNLLCAYCKTNTTEAERAEALAMGFIDERCCARHTLSKEPDFLEQEEWLTEVVKGRGHKIIFFPKFHCELNFIEMVWGWMKSYHRRNCTYNYLHLKNNLPNTMLVEMPIKFIRKAARHCYRFMSGYRQGLDGPLLDYTMKTYSGHRRIPDIVLIEVQAAYDKSRKK